MRAHLLRPDHTEPIETVKDVVDSGLPWNFVFHGFYLEHFMEKHEDGDYKRFWDEKETLEYDEFPFERVRHRTKPMMFCSW